MTIKSPLRYPGGKSRAVGFLMPRLFPFKEFREPFVGGGSIFLAVKQMRGNDNKKYWINDINYPLFCFWKQVQDHLPKLVETINEIKLKYKVGRELYEYYRNLDTASQIDQAVRFFIMNRITFSGTVDSGGYSEQAFLSRFTDSSIERLSLLSGMLKNVDITNGDFQELIKKEGTDVLIFLDPPYLSATKSKLYGKKGDLHTQFDHLRLTETLKNCKHKWIMTYDNCEEIKNLYSFANLYEWKLQYGMNNYKQKNASEGEELLITNYDLRQTEQLQLPLKVIG